MKYVIICAKLHKWNTVEKITNSLRSQNFVLIEKIRFEISYLKKTRINHGLSRKLKVCKVPNI